MKQSLVNLVLTILILLCFSCAKVVTTETATQAAAQDIRYYSSIVFRETPYAQMQGLIQLSKEQIAKRAHYRFVYDQEERIIEVAFSQDSTYKLPNHTADNHLFPTSIMRMKFEENREIRSFYNQANQRVSVRGEVYQEVYETDERGYRKTMHFEDKAGNKINNNWGVSNYTWEIQANGTVIEKRFNLTGEPQPLRPGFEFYTILLHYDPNGYIALMQNIDENGNLLENESGAAQDKLDFDSKGRWLGWQVLDKYDNPTEGNGPNVARGINTSDEFGYETAIKYEDSNGKAIKNHYGFWGSRRFYDEYGNFSHTYFVDSLGNPAPHEIAGYTYAIYEWDKDGMNRISTQLLDVNKRAIAHKTRGYSIVKYQYDDRSNLIKVSYFDESGKLINRLDNGVAYIAYEYDEIFSKRLAKKYNKNGQEID